MLSAADYLDNATSKGAPKYSRFLNDNITIQPSASRYDFVVFECAMASVEKFLDVDDAQKAFRFGPTLLPSTVLNLYQLHYALVTSCLFDKRDMAPLAYTWSEVKERINAAFERSHPVVEYID